MHAVTRYKSLLNFFLCWLCFSFPSVPGAQPIADSTHISDTAALNLKVFAETIVARSSSNFEKARTLLDWLSNSFAWTATDYKQRTVKEILLRKGGNCFELARVYMTLINELGIQYRPIAEINLHIPSNERNETAEKKIKDFGNKMSVFGYQHNDHRWVEVYDDITGEWIPVDPTTDLIGYDQWLKGRAWFGPRHTINDEISGDMIAPFAIFVVDRNNASKMLENRTEHYMVNKLNLLYHDTLARLSSWPAWKMQLAGLSQHAQAAFEGTENLHNFAKEISELRMTYDKLKDEYMKVRGR